ncbi:MAG: LytTR family DNA-binding domain-containing protein, partial [Hymenobacteraceae bacterium]|nr:LytTR family DNA-binding domain-containing protein [Hymenobacteraceae bacterium]
GVIFTTAFDEYAINSFETNALDNLLKPFSKERFEASIRKWLQSQAAARVIPATNVLEEVTGKQPEEQHRIVVRAGNNIRIIPVGEVLYLEAFDDYVKIHTRDGVFLKKKTMSYYEKALDPRQFVRVHRSYIMALSQLTRIEPFEKDSHVALLRNGERIPLSKSGYTRLRSVLGI